MLFQTKRHYKKRSTKQKTSYEEVVNIIEDIVEEPKQCHGPGCTEFAREGSKYCSDECGLKLAQK